MGTVASRVAAEVERGAARLERAGIENPRRESSLIWAALRGDVPGKAWLRRNDPVDPVAAERFEKAIARRATGEPIQYVVGTVGFRTLELEIDSRALIPRPETEGLVSLVLEWMGERRGSASWGTAADVGTGSGCVALSLAVEGAFDRVIAIDASPAALALAKRNRAAIAPRVPVEFRVGSLLAPLEADSVDAIVSNPPYLTEAEHTRLETDVRDYEPREALVAGPTGLEHTRGLLEGAGRVLRPGGLLAIELDSTRSEITCLTAEHTGWRARVERDLFGRPRFLVATRS